MYIHYNPNPRGNFVGDCVIRAICKLTVKSWDDAYLNVAIQGFMMKDMPTANHVWGAYLKFEGYSQHLLPDTCPDCYTVMDFYKLRNLRKIGTSHYHQGFAYRA